MRRTLILAISAVALAAPAAAQQLDSAPAHLSAKELDPRLRYRRGEVVLGNSLATLQIPAEYRYLDPHQTDQVLQAWGNPPDPETLGMIVPSRASPLAAEGWAVVITYDGSGFVKDNDAATLDYDKLMKQMREAVEDDNKRRKEAGYGTFSLVGWAEPPRYDSAAHKLYWAKELAFAGESLHTLNYNIRILGRGGVLVLNAVATMAQIGEIRQATPDVLSMVNFTTGHRYADFVPGKDKVAEYGIAALIVGGIAAKAGLFKILLGVLIAAKKLVIVGIAAAGAFFRKLFRKKPPEPAATP
jgi:uncharacterized membrane-anchored protein